MMPEPLLKSAFQSNTFEKYSAHKYQQFSEKSFQKTLFYMKEFIFGTVTALKSV